LAFFVVAIALRVPFRSRLPYHWDSAEFAIALRDYNVALSQPHAPGYFLYVMLGKLLNCVVGDPHASLVWLSVLCGGGLVAVVYVLGAEMFGRRAGSVAALLAMTSPQTWFHSCVALTYIVDGFLVSVTVLACWRAVKRGAWWRDAVLIGALAGIVGGVRQQSVPGLVPIALFALWKAGDRRVLRVILAGAIAVAVGLAWFVPMIELSGGLNLYLEIVRRHTTFNAASTWVGGGWQALQWNVFFAALFCLNGLMLGAVVLIAALLCRIGWLDVGSKRAWDLEHRVPLRVVALWVLPMIVMATVVGFTKQPGYVLSYLPGMMVLIGGTVGCLRGNRFNVVATCLVGVNVVAFVVQPLEWRRWGYGLARTAGEIRRHDEEIARAANAIRESFRGSDVALCHAQTYLHFGLRQFQLILPEFEQYQLNLDPTMVTPPERPMMAVRDGGLEFVRKGEPWQREKLVLVVPPTEGVNVFGQYVDIRNATPLVGSSGTAYVLTKPTGDQ
jgi:hypothetical protein